MKCPLMSLLYEKNEIRLNKIRINLTYNILDYESLRYFRKI